MGGGPILERHSLRIVIVHDSGLGFAIIKPKCGSIMLGKRIGIKARTLSAGLLFDYVSYEKILLSKVPTPRALNKRASEKVMELVNTRLYIDRAFS